MVQLTGAIGILETLVCQPFGTEYPMLQEFHEVPKVGQLGDMTGEVM